MRNSLECDARAFSLALMCREHHLPLSLPLYRPLTYVCSLAWLSRQPRRGEPVASPTVGPRQHHYCFCRINPWISVVVAHGRHARCTETVCFRPRSRTLVALSLRAIIRSTSCRSHLVCAINVTYRYNYTRREKVWLDQPNFW